MKRYLIIAFVLLAIASVLLPVVLRTNGEVAIQVIDHISFILAAVCGLITVVIAIMLYDRYGVGAKAKERIMDAVNDAIEEIQKVDFVLLFNSEGKGKDAPKDYVITLSFQSKKENVTEYLTPEALSSTLYYKYSGMAGCSQLCQRTQSSVFLPKKIVEAVQRLSVFTYEQQDVAEGTRPLTILSAHSDTINNSADTLDGKDTYVPTQALSVVQFVDAYFGVKAAIVEWYKNNGINPTNLNMGLD